MALHLFVFLFVVSLLFLARLGRLCWFPLRQSSSQAVAKRSTLPRRLQPRSPDDCPACRLVSTPSSDAGQVSAPVRPWSEAKSRRGAPKRIPTEGFACPNRQCRYFGNTDAREHALVGDGKHGRAEQIQTFRCQACRTTFSARRDTPLYRLKTPSQQVTVVLSALAEGLDPSAAERVFGFRQATITRWLTRAGEHAELFHERCFRNLHLPHMQLDHCCEPGYAAISRYSGSGLPLIPARKFFLSCIWVPEHNTWPIASSIPCESSWPPFCLPLFTSDGLNVYFYALTAHFGQWLTFYRRGSTVRRWQVAAELIYGQVKKSYRRRKLVRVTHVMRLVHSQETCSGMDG